MHPLERRWKRATIHAVTVRAMRAEASRAEPDFDRLAARILEKYGKGLPRRHLQAVGLELADLAHAAKTVRAARQAYAGRPGDLYFALFGRRPKSVQLLRTPFSLSFSVPLSEMAVYKKERDFKGLGGLSHPESVSESPERQVAVQRVQAELGVGEHYLRGLSACHSVQSLRNPVVEHEEAHVIRALVDAHLPNRGVGPAFSVVHSANSSPSSTGYQPKVHRLEEAYALWLNCYPHDIASTLAKHGYASPSEGKRAWGVLGRIYRLQRKYRLSNRFVQALFMEAKDLSDVADAIMHNTQGRRPTPPVIAKKKLNPLRWRVRRERARS